MTQPVLENSTTLVEPPLSMKLKKNRRAFIVARVEALQTPR